MNIRRWCLIVAGAGVVGAACTPADAAAVQEVRPPVQLNHEFWTVEDGLPVNSVTSLLQSRDGYIWAATFDGLVRFDGARFSTFNTGSSPDLPSSRITDLTETVDGSLWLLTEQNHLVRYHAGEFTHFREEQGLRDNSAVTLLEDEDGVLWVGTTFGLGVIRGDRFVPVAPEIIEDEVSVLELGADGRVWVGSNRGARVYLVVDGVATALDVAGVEGGGTRLGGPVNGLYEDAEGTLWIGTRSGAGRYADGRVEVVSTTEWPNDSGEMAIRQFFRDAGGTVWVSAHHGAGRVRDGVFQQFAGLGTSRPSRDLIQSDEEGRVWFSHGTTIYVDGVPAFVPDSASLRFGPTSHIVSTMLTDREGSVWFGTEAAGLHRLKRAPFTTYSVAEGLPFPNVYSVLEDRSGDVWIGTYGGGLARFREGRVSEVVAKGESLLDYAQSLLQLQSGALWVGYTTGPQGVHECTTGAEVRCRARVQAVLGVFAMHQDPSGSLWIGTGSGLWRGPPDAPSPLGPGSGAPTSPVRAFLPTRDGALWMATNGGGLARYDEGRFTHFGEADGLPSPLIRSLYQDTDGWLWIGTEGRGLVRADPVAWPRRTAPGGDARASGETEVVGDGGSDRSVVSIRITDGLFDDVIHSILEDDFGRLWMSTNRGIFWVLREELVAFADGDVDRVRSTGYTERDGLRNREANGGAQPSATKSMDGRLWFATQDGVAVVDPADITRSQRDTPVLVEEVVVGERVIRADTGAISLLAEERDLEVRYTGLSFLAPENVRFRYRLEPYQDEWVEAGSRRTAFFTGVPPGRYDFRVVASNEAGVWTEHAATVSVTIAPFFYETGLFRGLALALFGLLGVGGHQWRLRALRQREQELTELVDARTLNVREHRTQLEIQNRQLAEQSEQLAALDRSKSRFFANVSHELRVPLTLTIGPLEDLKGRLEGDGTDENAADIDLALRNSRRLLRLVTQILDVAKLEAHALTPRIWESDLTSLLRAVGESFAPLAERRGVEYRLELPDEEVPVFFDVDLMEKVIVNLLSNALKFTAKGRSVRVSLVAEEVGGEVVMTVRDSGHGISPEAQEHVFERFYRAESAEVSLQPGTGIGLSLARELVELHGGRITLESEIGFGSTFKVVLSSGSTHLNPTWIVDPTTDVTTGAAVLRPGSTERAIVVDGGAVVDGTERAGAATDDHGDDDDARRTVLLVDDNAEVRAYVRRHLEEEYHVVEAADGVEGLRLAGERLPDLIITDLVMPEMDGAGLVRRLREDASLAFIPVILLTARADKDQRVALLDLGADDYVTKPFDAAELEARVENLIRSRMRLREAARREAILRPTAPEAESADEVFLDRVRRVIEENLGDEDFDVERLAAALGYGRSSLYRRLQELLEESPAEIILAIRLDRAGDLLRARAGTVGEIAYGVGFKSVSHFSRRFRQRFGVPPSRYAEVVAQPESGAPQPQAD